MQSSKINSWWGDVETLNFTFKCVLEIGKLLILHFTVNQEIAFYPLQYTILPNWVAAMSIFLHITTILWEDGIQYTCRMVVWACGGYISVSIIKPRWWTTLCVSSSTDGHRTSLLNSCSNLRTASCSLLLPPWSKPWTSHHLSSGLKTGRGLHTPAKTMQGVDTFFYMNYQWNGLFGKRRTFYLCVAYTPEQVGSIFLSQHGHILITNLSLKFKFTDSLSSCLICLTVLQQSGNSWLIQRFLGTMKFHEFLTSGRLCSFIMNKKTKQTNNVNQFSWD